MPPATTVNPAMFSQLVNVGENYCLFRPDSHALALVNGRAAKILAARIGSIDTSAFRPCIVDDEAASQNEHALSEAEALVEQLGSAGFLDCEAPGQALGRAHHTGCLMPSSAAQPALDASFSLGEGPIVRLVCVDRQLSKLLSAALSPMRVHGDAGQKIEMYVVSDEETFGIWRDGIAIATGLDRVAARRICLQAMAMAMLPAQDVAALLHASSVSMNGRAVILAGASGSGKTTLMMALVGAGARFLADDLTALHPDGKSVLAFPLAASVKKGSWQVLQEQFPQLENCWIHSVGERRVRYVDPSPGKPSDTVPVPAAALIFPEFAPAPGDVETERLSPEEALSLLFTSGSEIVGARRSVLPLSRLVNEMPAWRLRFPDAGSGVKAVEKLAGRGR